MNGKPLWILILGIIAAIALGGWYRTNNALSESRSQTVLRELQPISHLLKENEVLINELRSEPFAEKDLGILESYLAKIRRDTAAKHADLKQRLDTLAENNTAIVTLVKAYGPNAKTASFTSESEKFRTYASVWRDRWNGVMDLFMAGGNYAPSSVAFPAGFAAAVDAEIAANR